MADQKQSIPKRRLDTYQQDSGCSTQDLEVGGLQILRCLINIAIWLSETNPEFDSSMSMVSTKQDVVLADLCIGLVEFSSPANPR